MPIDWEFIQREEGKGVQVGYLGPSNKSGLTIGSGFDIGQQDSVEIDKLEINSTLKRKLQAICENYCEKDRTESQQLGALLGKNELGYPKSTLMDMDDPLSPIVQRKPVLKLTSSEIKELDIAVKKRKSKIFIGLYNRQATSKKGTFDDLPSEIQTAIASFCFQFGEYVGALKDTSDRRTLLWNAFVNHDWPAAIKILQSRFMDKYISRRQHEIQLIQRGMQSGTGPQIAPRKLP